MAEKLIKCLKLEFWLVKEIIEKKNKKKVPSIILYHIGYMKLGIKITVLY